MPIIYCCRYFGISFFSRNDLFSWTTMDLQFCRKFICRSNVIECIILNNTIWIVFFCQLRLFSSSLQPTSNFLELMFDLMVVRNKYVKIYKTSYAKSKVLVYDCWKVICSYYTAQRYRYSFPPPPPPPPCRHDVISIHNERKLNLAVTIAYLHVIINIDKKSCQLPIYICVEINVDFFYTFKKNIPVGDKIQNLDLHLTMSPDWDFRKRMLSCHAVNVTISVPLQSNK